VACSYLELANIFNTFWHTSLFLLFFGFAAVQSRLILVGTGVDITGHLLNAVIQLYAVTIISQPLFISLSAALLSPFFNFGYLYIDMH